MSAVQPASASSASSLTATQRTYLFSGALVVLAGLVYFFGVRGTEAAAAKARQEAGQLATEQMVVQHDLHDSHEARTRRAELEKAREPYLGALLTPLLGSWSMRAKSVLDPLAADVGLKVSDYTELPARALPVPNPLPLQLYARQPVRVVCRGSYAQVASFILRVEKLLPYVALQALTIKAQQDPAAQLATLVFEWPVKGALSRTVPAPAKGGAQ